jgi:hypothetical protein
MAETREDLLRQMVSMLPQTEMPSPTPPLPPQQQQQQQQYPQVTFWIIKTRKPKLSIERWHDGKLQGRTLRATMEAISGVLAGQGQSRRIASLELTLRTCSSETLVQVDKDTDEAQWDKIKLELGREMQSSFRANRNDGQSFEISIEPVYEANEANDIGLSYADGEIEIAF